MGRITTDLCEKWMFWFGEEPKGEGELVCLPHDWASDAPTVRDVGEAASGFRVRRGTGWYRRIISVCLRRGRRYFLDFGGIYEQSSIYVNGKPAGGRRYGYSPFRLEITEFLQNGENRIDVRVDCTVTPTDRWYTGAGIYRTVQLIETGSEYLEEQEIVVDARFVGEDAQITVSSPVSCVSGQLFSPEGSPAGSADTADGSLVFSVHRPLLWSAGTPYLYRLCVTVPGEDGTVQDEVSIRIGLRDVRFLPNKGLFINGEEVKLRGVCLHQDVGCLGVAAKKEVWKDRLLLLKKAGCNAIRAAHHVYSGEFLDLCDELGFYVYAEAFDKWTGGHYAGFFETEWKADLDAMVKWNRNRPCILLWGAGNEVENQGQPSMLRLLEQITAYLHRLDPSRPVSYAMNPHFKRESGVNVSEIQDIQQFVDEADETEIWDLDEKIRRICRIGEIVDIIGCNYQEQWYERIHDAMPGKLILGTETYQFFRGHPEQFKNFTLDNPVLAPDRYPYVIGGMIWTGYSYLGESKDYLARGGCYGLFRTNNEPRSGYDIIRSYWTKEPMVRFLVMDYTVRDEGPKDHWDLPPYFHHWCFQQFGNVVLPYAIATNCEEVELYVNDERIYVQRPECYPSRLISGFLPWRPGTVTVIGKVDGKEVCRDLVRTPGPAVRLRFDEKELYLPAKRGYQKLLTVRAMDASATPCFRESAAVRFWAEGPVQILAVDNGNMKSLEPYRADTIHCFHGAASVMIACAGQEGRAILHAQADGMEEGRLEIVLKDENDVHKGES